MMYLVGLTAGLCLSEDGRASAPVRNFQASVPFASLSGFSFFLFFSFPFLSLLI